MKSIQHKKLSRLIAKVEELSARQVGAQNEVARLEQQLYEEQNKDLDAQAVALHAGIEPPEPKSPEVEKRLSVAKHNFEVSQRALAIAQSELSTFYSQNAHKLEEQRQQAEAQRAMDLSEAIAPALEKLRKFYECRDERRLLSQYLAEPERENDGPPQDSVVFIQPRTRANIFGDDRIAGLQPGEIENVLGELAALGSRYAAGGDAETAIVGPVPDEDEGAA